MLELIQSLNSGGALILAALVLANPNGYNKRGNLWLGLFMMAVFVQLFEELLVMSPSSVVGSYLGSISILVLLLIPILLFFGILFYVKPSTRLTWRILIYFLLPLGYLLAIFFSLLSSGEGVILNRDREDGSGAIFHALLFLLFLIEIAIFWYKGHQLLTGHQKNTLDYSAAKEEVDLSWLKHIHYAYLGMILAWVLTMFIHTDWMLLIANTVFLIGTFLIAYHSMRQKAVFPEDRNEEQEIQLFLESKKVPQEQPKKPSEIDLQLKEQLLTLMKTEQLYLDNEINLAKLSKKLDTSTHQLSATLNTAIGQNFSNFINNYRIEAAKLILIDPKKQHYTMLQVAFEAGFNSKTVFNTCFKRSTTASPTAYKKSHFSTISA